MSESPLLSTELSDKFQEHLRKTGWDEEAIPKAVQELEVILRKTLEELEVMTGRIETPLTIEGAAQVVKAYKGLPRSLQLAEEAVGQEPQPTPKDDPWKAFIGMFEEPKEALDSVV